MKEKKGAGEEEGEATVKLAGEAEGPGGALVSGGEVGGDVGVTVLVDV